MVDERGEALDFLGRLGRNPAVAFYESGVAATVVAILEELGVAHRFDEFGNIVARIPGGEASATPLAIVAHMDHPGFEITGRSGDRFVADGLGGVPASSFGEGVPLQLLLPGGSRLPAVTAGRHGEESDRQVLIRLAGPDESGAVEPPVAAVEPPVAAVEPPVAAVFDLVDFELDGEFIRMRAADDLAGCGAILAALAQLSRGGVAPSGDVYGLFTRAEEVGLVGARLAAEAGTLPLGTLVISAEASRTLPGAEQGKGPVIRVGDAGSTFDADAESVLIRARESLLERDPERDNEPGRAGEAGFKSQRQLMSGGVCEASAFAVYGYQVTGIAFPLGNYHNAAPDGGVEAEFIHVDDYLGGIALLTEAAHRVADRSNTAFRQRLREVPGQMRQRLVSG